MPNQPFHRGLHVQAASSNISVPSGSGALEGVYITYIYKHIYFYINECFHMFRSTYDSKKLVNSKISKFKDRMNIFICIRGIS